MVDPGTSRTPPTITAVEVLDSRTVRLTLDRAIDIGAWAVFTHVSSDTTSRLGYLPGDADQSGVADPRDIEHLIGCMASGNGPSCEEFQSDIDRSGMVPAVDLLRLIDLLIGAGEMDPWIHKSIGRPPCATP